ncbi:MAG: hypothetical protein K5694_06240 [Bacilli bacterium]|nr:hypothetical protein [Bacilli bacterium]
MKLLSRTIKISAAEVANSVVRAIIAEISKNKFGNPVDQDMIDNAAYFDFKCPYTGRDIKAEVLAADRSNLECDHVVPTNIDSCGLNCRANILLVDKAANHKKGESTVEEFLLHDTDVLGDLSLEERQKRLDKIHAFQKDRGYNPEEVKKIVKAELEKYMDAYKDEQNRLIKKLSGLIVTKDDAVIKHLQDFRTYLDAKVKSTNTIDSYFACVKRVIKAEGINIATFQKKIDRILVDYAPGGEKDPDDRHTTICALRKYKEFMKDRGLYVPATHRKGTTSSKAPIDFTPSDLEVFKSELMAKKEATITWIYKNGTNSTKIWKANKIKPTTNIRGNIASRPEYFDPSLVRVEVKIK